MTSAPVLWTACERGDIESVRSALNQDNVDVLHRGVTPAFLAAFNGHEEILKLLHSHGAAMDQPFTWHINGESVGPSGTPLEIATVYGGLSDFVAHFLLWEAARDGDVREVQSTLALCNDVNTQYMDMTPSCVAALNANFMALGLLKSAGADLNKQCTFTHNNHKITGTTLEVARDYGHLNEYFIKILAA